MTLVVLAVIWLLLSLILSVRIGGLLKRSANSQIAKPIATMATENRQTALIDSAGILISRRTFRRQSLRFVLHGLTKPSDQRFPPFILDLAAATDLVAPQQGGQSDGKSETA